MATHTIKLHKEFCDAVLSGVKPFELRYNDRDYQVGDTVRFVPWDPLTASRVIHEIQRHEYRITYILRNKYYGLSEGYVAFGIREEGEQDG